MSIALHRRHTFTPSAAQVDQLAARRRDQTDAQPALSPMAAAVHQAIEAMHQDLLCDRGIGGIAEDTFYSKFHFTREFTKLTGTTPRRFLAALRMNKAKELLVTTSFGIADVSNMVGYSSVGTFSSRFSSLVGISPKEWRTGGGRVHTVGPCPGDGHGVVHGTVTLGEHVCVDTPLYVGVYPDTVPQGRPVASTIIDQPGPFEIHGVPAGTWSLIVQAGCADSPAGLRGHSSITVWAPAAHTVQLPTQVTLDIPCLLDPPAVFEGSRMWEDGYALAGQLARRQAG